MLLDIDPVPAGADETAQPDRSRLPIDLPERQARDRGLADCLERLGQQPRSATTTTVVVMETGETFTTRPMREHWAFATTAKMRAADFVLTYTAFDQQTDTAHFHAFVLRPEFRKAELGELAETIKALTKRYGRVMDKAKERGQALPVAVFVHIRWDSNLSKWDVHLHCVVDVKPGMLDKFHLRLCNNFSTPKHIADVKSMGAWVNYSASWIVDHRDIKKWPDEALLELWALKSPHLMRKGGAFAAFAGTLKDQNVGWEDNRVVTTPKAPRQTRQKAPEGPSGNGDRVALVMMRVGGHRRLCAIHRQRRDEEVRDPPRTAAASPDQDGPMYPTTITRSIPPPTTRLSHAQPRLRRRMAVWNRIWDYGTDARPPRPIVRRLAKDGVVIAPRRSGLHVRRQGQL